MNTTMFFDTLATQDQNVFALTKRENGDVQMGNLESNKEMIGLPIHLISAAYAELSPRNDQIESKESNMGLYRPISPSNDEHYNSYGYRNSPSPCHDGVKFAQRNTFAQLNGQTLVFEKFPHISQEIFDNSNNFHHQSANNNIQYSFNNNNYRNHNNNVNNNNNYGYFGKSRSNHQNNQPNVNNNSNNRDQRRRPLNSYYRYSPDVMIRRAHGLTHRFKSRSDIMKIDPNPPQLLNGGLYDQLSQAIYDVFTSKAQKAETYENKIQLWKDLFLYIRIWQMNITENGAVNQEVISDLTRHQRAVNCVRWSNTGQYLASGDDDANIIIWQLKTDNIPLLEGDTGDKETWIIYKILRGHKEDVYDICWSVDGTKILSGSVDNTAILWDVTKGKLDHILSDHKGFVQGVSWDPKNQLIATISTDRICRIYDPFEKQIKARIQKGKLSVPDTHYFKDKDVKFFHDDTFKSFFRRLHFTPDGSLLIVPSGHIEADNCKHVLNATLVFTLDNFSSPAIILPIPHQSSTVVRCCPILFALHEDGPDPIIKLPYRMIFAVATDHDVILYDTQQTLPFARFQDIHYTRLTDLTWSKDGLLLIASSTDGFCSLITFDVEELGVPWVKTESEGEDNAMDISGIKELADKIENVDINNKDIAVEDKISKLKENSKEESKKRPSFLEQWALKTPKKKKLNPDEKNLVSKKEDIGSKVIKTPDFTMKNHPAGVNSCEKMDTKNTEPTKNRQDEVIEILDSPEKNNPAEKTDTGISEQKKKDGPVNRLIPRRITPIKVDKNIKKPLDLKEKEDLCVSKEKVNILIPRRIKPKPVEAKASTSQEDTTTCSTPRRDKLGVEQEPLKDEEDSSDSEPENLSKEELEDLHKASENIREFFCRVPKRQETHGDAKLIAVKKKPGESGKIESVAKNSIFTAKHHSDAKPIEVRRKPRDREVNQNTVTSLAKNNLDVRKESKNFDAEKCTKIRNTEKLHTDRVKEANQTIGETNNKNRIITDNVVEQDDKSSKDVIVLVESDNKEYSSTPKKSKSEHSASFQKTSDNKPLKIKVSSLVTKKSPSKTPKKINSLLNFLQKSAEKKKKEKKDETRIELGLEGNEARDAWKCDTKQPEGEDIKKNEDSSRTVPVDDDETEYFCLQLEDSQEGRSESQLSQECQSSEISQSGESKINQGSGSVQTKETDLTSNSAQPNSKSKIEKG